MPSLIGHERVLSFFAQAKASEQLAHAYLFIGPDGVGKTTVIETLIREWIGPKGFEHPDVLVLRRLEDEKTGKTKTGISVEQIREARAWMSLSPLVAPRKIVFIEDAARLTTEASNALLKTLEEPPATSMLILRAQDPREVPATIASRCQWIRFAPVPTDQIAHALKQIGADAQQAAELAAESRGCPGKALSLWKDSEAQAEQAVALAQFEQLLSAETFGRLVATGSLLGKEETDRRDRAEALLTQWELWVRDALLASVGAEDLASRASATRWTAQQPTTHWLSALSSLRESRSALASNVNPLAALDLAALAL